MPGYFENYFRQKIKYLRFYLILRYYYSNLNFKEMKKPLILLMLVITILSSCNRKELEKLKQENQNLQTIVEQKDAEINSIITLLNEIEDNLSGIRMREQRILKASSGVENSANQVDNIKSDIMAIDELMKKNKENLDLLSQRLKTVTGEKQQFEKMVNNLNAQVESKDREIQKLVADLEDKDMQINDLYSSVAQLKTEKAEKEQVIDKQDKDLHKGYYLIGNTKELRERGIIIRSGGVLGMGKVDKLSDDLNPADFTLVDIRQAGVFVIDAKNADLLSVHPSDSYIIRKSDDGKQVVSFEITRKDDFWKNSRYMVLALD